tara:strand:- start:1015 stop:1137 length:123 start_codon:yes stop_codon:yes gene_type:complete
MIRDLRPKRFITCLRPFTAILESTVVNSNNTSPGKIVVSQ